MSLGSDLDATLASLSARIAALEHPVPPPVDPPADPPTDPPVDPPVDPPDDPPVVLPPVDVPPVTDPLAASPDGTRGVRVITTNLDTYTLGAEPGPYGGGYPILRNDQPLGGVGVEFLWIHARLFVSSFGYWHEITADGVIGPSAVGDPFALPASSSGPPTSGGTGPVTPPAPTALALFPLPDPIPSVPVTNHNPTRLTAADITFAEDDWFDVRPDPDVNPNIQLGYMRGFKLRRVDGDLRMVVAGGGDWNSQPPSAIEFSLSGLVKGRLNTVRFTNEWSPKAFSGSEGASQTNEYWTPGEHLGIGINPFRPHEVWHLGSLDYAGFQLAHAFKRTVGPHGTTQDLCRVRLGDAIPATPDHPPQVDGLNGKECHGGFIFWPARLRQQYGFREVGVVGGQYTSLMAQAASASLGLFVADLDDIGEYAFPQPIPDQFVVPVIAKGRIGILADHRSGSTQLDWAHGHTVDPHHIPQPAGQQTFDRGTCLPDMVSNWLDMPASVGMENYSRSGEATCRIDGDVLTMLSGSHWDPTDFAPLSVTAAWWQWWFGFTVQQHGQPVKIEPVAHIEIEGVRTPVKVLEFIGEWQIRVDHDFGTVDQAYFTGPSVMDTFQQIGFDDRQQWNGVFPDGFGRWSWDSGYLQTWTLIADEDATKKQGLIGLMAGGLGALFYNHSTFMCQSSRTELHIIDVDDLGKAKQGLIAPHMVQPAEITLLQPLTDDARRFAARSGSQGTLHWGKWSGLDWDRETDDLYAVGNLISMADTGGHIRIRRGHVNRAMTGRS
jgi:hypothetical protein